MRFQDHVPDQWNGVDDSSQRLHGGMANGLELSGPAETPSSEIAELAGSAPASG